jgi:hypothetical protein
MEPTPGATGYVGGRLVQSLEHPGYRLRCLARLGGFLARTGDGDPSVQTIWQGYQRLHEFIYALEIHRAINASQMCIMVSR